MRAFITKKASESSADLTPVKLEKTRNSPPMSSSIRLRRSVPVRVVALKSKRRQKKRSEPGVFGDHLEWLDPMFVPHRNHPRFEKLACSPSPKSKKVRLRG